MATKDQHLFSATGRIVDTLTDGRRRSHTCSIALDTKLEEVADANQNSGRVAASNIKISHCRRLPHLCMNTTS